MFTKLQFGFLSLETPPHRQPKWWLSNWVQTCRECPRAVDLKILRKWIILCLFSNNWSASCILSYWLLLFWWWGIIGIHRNTKSLAPADQSYMCGTEKKEKLIRKNIQKYHLLHLKNTSWPQKRTLSSKRDTAFKMLCPETVARIRVPGCTLVCLTAIKVDSLCISSTSTSRDSLVAQW